MVWKWAHCLSSFIVLNSLYSKKIEKTPNKHTKYSDGISSTPKNKQWIKKPNKPTNQTKKFKLILIAVLYPSHNEAQEGHQEGHQAAQEQCGATISFPLCPHPPLAQGVCCDLSFAGMEEKKLFFKQLCSTQGLLIPRSSSKPPPRPPFTQAAFH